ncbi:hypothetical protein [Crateriforma conspicua]|uniref:Uncharacterized protein n=1 Tax=Crateriforma conspicua TaxID=2527996 RepID=A0A5C5Y3R3_9PLAN|nr:hypothetical protein [Crateriforma conspicua]TWT69449.1 hypothetical protein Pan14r_17350 [Crateriforma conspicua]
MSDSNTQKAIQQFVAVFRRMLSTGRHVAAEDAARAVKTDDGFDRRAFGPVVAAMKRDGEIVSVGFRTSENAKHHAGIKRLWVSASIQQKRGADHAK